MARFGVGVGCMLFTLVMLVVVVGTSEKQHKPFIDQSCLARDCSWSWETPTAGTQFCEQVTYSDINICPNPFGSPSAPEQRPAPANSLNVTDINKPFNLSGTEGGALEQYTCLVIKYRIDKVATTFIKGLQVSVRGMEDPDLNHFDCLVQNFSNGLQYYSVENRLFTSKCFCGVKPGRRYKIVVRTLPVDDNDLDQYDTQVTDDYLPAHCGTENKVNDIRCRKNEEARWSPECIITKQNTQTGDYDIIEVTFPLAPERYNFDKYFIAVYRFEEPPVPGPPTEYVMIEMHSITQVNVTCPNTFTLGPAVTHRFNVSDKQWLGSANIAALFYVKIQPRPSTNQCRNAEEKPDTCKKTESSSFQVIPNPCKDDPCNPQGVQNAIGTCIPMEENYICSCKLGYMEHDGKCTVDPCWFLLDTESTWGHHCRNGQCIYSQDHTDFACNCNASFVYLKTPKVCEVDPCAKNSETNMTICGIHGKCNMNLTDDHVSYSCICDEGYHYDETCKAKASVGMIVGISLASCLMGLLLFLGVIFCFFQPKVKRHHVEQADTPPVRQDNTYRQQLEMPVSKRRVLPIYSNDHKYHKQVVHCFCRLLRTHCKCDVSLWEWYTYVAPTIQMWLTNEIEKADVVLLICSKGTGIKYKAKAKRDKVGTDCQDVYGDVFVKALTILDQYFNENNASEKFVVAYFDYSSENDIPVTFKRFAKYRLMECMESLYLRIHNKLRDGPHSSRQVSDLEEHNYPELEMGKPLFKAIQDMKSLIKREPNWYEKSNSQSIQEPEFALSASPDTSHFIQQTSVNDSLQHQDSVDSAYDTGSPIRVHPAIFGDSSSSVDSSSTDLEELMQKFQSMPPQSDGHVIDMNHEDMNHELDDFLVVQLGNDGPRQNRAESFT